MDILWKAALAGLVVAGALLLARTPWWWASGLLFLFPSFSLPAFYFMAVDAGVPRMREALLTAVFALPVWLVWAGTLYVLVDRLPLVVANAIALLAWALAAAGLVLLRSRAFA